MVIFHPQVAPDGEKLRKQVKIGTIHSHQFSWTYLTFHIHKSYLSSHSYQTFSILSTLTHQIIVHSRLSWDVSLTVVYPYPLQYFVQGQFDISKSITSSKIVCTVNVTSILQNGSHTGYIPRTHVKSKLFFFHFHFSNIFFF